MLNRLRIALDVLAIAVLAAAGGGSTPPASTQPASLAAAAGGESTQPARLATMKLHPRLPPNRVKRAPHLGVANATAAAVLLTSPSTERATAGTLQATEITVDELTATDPPKKGMRVLLAHCLHTRRVNYTFMLAPIVWTLRDALTPASRMQSWTPRLTIPHECARDVNARLCPTSIGHTQWLQMSLEMAS